MISTKNKLSGDPTVVLTQSTQGSGLYVQGQETSRAWNKTIHFLWCPPRLREIFHESRKLCPRILLIEFVQRQYSFICLSVFLPYRLAVSILSLAPMLRHSSLLYASRMISPKPLNPATSWCVHELDSLPSCWRKLSSGLSFSIHGPGTIEEKSSQHCASDLSP